MNELIKIIYDNDRPTVSARELHEFLEVSTEYRHWFPRMCEYGFIEGQDFRSFLTESIGGRPAQDAQLTIDMAKEICMLQRNEKGANNTCHGLLIFNAIFRIPFILLRKEKYTPI